MSTARAAYQKTKKRLTAAGYTAVIEANVLFELAVGQRYSELHPDTEMTPEQAEKLSELEVRRIGGEPLQYIAGRWPFLDFELAVGVGVLIPRPETEQVAEQAFALLAGEPQPDILDLCSGTGCLAIALARKFPQGQVKAVELSEGAAVYLKKNCAALAPKVQAVQADALGFEKSLTDASLNLIVSNPPYVTPAEYKEALDALRHEPVEAFLGGDDGLDFYRELTSRYRHKLKPDGYILFETGFNQTNAVADILAQAGFHEIQVVCDAYGLPRMVLARVAQK